MWVAVIVAAAVTRAPRAAAVATSCASTGVQQDVIAYCILSINIERCWRCAMASEWRPQILRWFAWGKTHHSGGLLRLSAHFHRRATLSSKSVTAVYRVYTARMVDSSVNRNSKPIHGGSVNDCGQNEGRRFMELRAVLAVFVLLETFISWKYFRIIPLPTDFVPVNKL